MDSILHQLGLGTLSENFLDERIDQGVAFSVSDSAMSDVGVNTIGDRIWLWELCTKYVCNQRQTDELPQVLLWVAGILPLSAPLLVITFFRTLSDRTAVGRPYISTPSNRHCDTVSASLVWHSIAIGRRLNPSITPAIPTESTTIPACGWCQDKNVTKAPHIIINVPRIITKATHIMRKALHIT